MRGQAGRYQHTAVGRWLAALLPACAEAVQYLAPTPAPLQFRYILAVSNAGDTALEDATVEDVLPEGVAAVAVASLPGGLCSVEGRLMRCKLGDLAVDAKVIIIITAKATQVGTWDNEAAGAGSNSEGVVKDNAIVEVKVGGVGEHWAGCWSSSMRMPRGGMCYVGTWAGAMLHRL